MRRRSMRRRGMMSDDGDDEVVDTVEGEDEQEGDEEEWSRVALSLMVMPLSPYIREQGTISHLGVVTLTILAEPFTIVIEWLFHRIGAQTRFVPRHLFASICKKPPMHVTRSSIGTCVPQMMIASPSFSLSSQQIPHLCPGVCGKKSHAYYHASSERVQCLFVIACIGSAHPHPPCHRYEAPEVVRLQMSSVSSCNCHATRHTITRIFIGAPNGRAPRPAQVWICTAIRRLPRGIVPRRRALAGSPAGREWGPCPQVT